MDKLTPTTHAEAVAVFRHAIIGAVTQAQMDRGQLAAALKALSKQYFRPPKSLNTKRFSVATLERWYYAFKERGLDGLKPEPRSDKGRAKELTPEQKTLLCDIRREHPSASVTLILRTLVADGRLDAGAVSATTVRRLFVDEGLDRLSLRGADGGGHTRLRWQAERPGALWHGDVCHGPALSIDGKARSLRVHALMDDASRYVVALEAHHHEREVDMLGVFVRALRKHGPPDALYLDNGATYRGDTLATACARIGTTLLHAKSCPTDWLLGRSPASVWKDASCSDERPTKSRQPSRSVRQKRSIFPLRRAGTGIGREELAVAASAREPQPDVPHRTAAALARLPGPVVFRAHLLRVVPGDQRQLALW